MRGSVLIVDCDRQVCGLVAELLTTEGFAVSQLVDRQPVSIEAEVARLEPDVVLLAGADRSGYGPAWKDAAWLHARNRPIAVIMFTAHAWDLAEAQLGESERSQRAAFDGFLAKPFELEALVNTVVDAMQQPAFG
jgi:DNA-binding NtrC family response regulator